MTLREDRTSRETNGALGGVLTEPSRRRPVQTVAASAVTVRVASSSVVWDPALSAARATGLGRPRRSASQPSAAEELDQFDAEVEAEKAGHELTGGQVHLRQDEGERHAVTEAEASGHQRLLAGEEGADGVDRADEDAGGDEGLDRPSGDVQAAECGGRQRDGVPGGEGGRDAADPADRGTGADQAVPAPPGGRVRRGQEQDQQEEGKSR